MPTRLLYLTTGCYDKGGISRYNRYQIRALRELLGESSVRVFSLLGPAPDGFEEPFATSYYAGGVSARFKGAFAMRVAMEMLRNRPSAVLAAHVNLSGFALSLARTFGARSLVNVYGAEVWSGFRRDVAWGLAKSDHVVSDCHFTADYIEKRGHRLGGKTSVIWDCVDLSRFYPGSPRPDILKKYGIPDPTKCFNLLTLGRMGADTAYKGYDRLLEVFKKVAIQNPDSRLIYGGGGAMVEILKDRAKRAQIEHRVCFTGFIHEQDLPDVYRSGHVFSLVTDRRHGGGEGIPLTPLEAAACSIPILVGNQDGSQEAVLEGVNGYVLSPFDLDSHAERLIKLGNEPLLRERMGKAARKRIEEEFSYDIFVSKHRRLLDTLELHGVNQE